MNYGDELWGKKNGRIFECEVIESWETIKVVVCDGWLLLIKK